MAITIKDIARESGYAISTVSRVLNNHSDVSQVAKERILAVVEAQNFQLNSNAKHLKQRQSTIIAIIVKGTMNVLFASIVEIMQEKVGEWGYTAAVHYVDESDDEVAYARQLCIERKPAGLAFLGGLASNFRQGFGPMFPPSVLVTISAKDLGFDNLSSVSVDDFAGAVDAMEFLVSKGHRKIGIIGGDLERSGPTMARFSGCLSVVSSRGLSFQVDRQFVQARYSYESGYGAMNTLLEQMPDLTAVFCMADVMAIGARRALGDKEKQVPQDISIIGYDGIPGAFYTVPRLATVCQDVQDIAQKSVNILKQAVLEGGPSEHILIPTTLTCGESVADLEARK